MPESTPFEVVLQSAAALFVSRCLQIVANNAVADALGDDVVTASALAGATGLNARALGRILGLLASQGIFERRDGGFAHNPTSRLLRSDSSVSLRPMVRMFGLPALWTAAQSLDHVVKTGRPNPDEFWTYLAENPEASRIFNDAMLAKSHAAVTATVAAYDFSRVDLICDVGGGRGHLLQAILAASPNSRGVLFDLPHVIEQASGIASERLSLRAGDFFRDRLPVCDAYILMDVIHDWTDEESHKILNAVRHAANPGARLLLIEAVMPDDPGPSWPKTLDAVMLYLGGSQRTADEHRTLLAGAGLRLERVIDIGGGYSILEADTLRERL
jgi:hypothetical protein